jgi:hypothetical protein
MKNKLLLTTALAGSLVAGSAIAQTAVTGSLTVSYKSVNGKENTASQRSFGKESQLNVSNKGKLNIGGLSYAAGFSLEFDGNDGIYSYSPGSTATASATIASGSANLTAGQLQVSTTVTGSVRQTGTSGWHLENNYIDIISESTGTTFTFSSDHIQNARGGMANIVGLHAEDFTGGVNNTTTSLSIDYAGTTVAESFGAGIVQNVGKLGKVSYLYVPNHAVGAIASTKNSVLATGGVSSEDGDTVLGGDDKPAAQEYGFIGDLGIKGLTVKAFKVEEGTVNGNLSKTTGTNFGVRYNYDIFTVAVAEMKQKVGGTTAAADALKTKQMEYGLGVAVNKDLSVGLYLNNTKKDATGVNEMTRSIALGYSLGPVALSAQYGQVDNMGGTTTADANVYYLALTTAF